MCALGMGVHIILATYRERVQTEGKETHTGSLSKASFTLPDSLVKGESTCPEFQDL